MAGISHEDFLDTSYRPADSELVCTFSVDPAAGMDMAAAASRVTSESSKGMWARLQAVDATVEGRDLDEYAESHPELSGLSQSGEPRHPDNA